METNDPLEEIFAGMPIPPPRTLLQELGWCKTSQQALDAVSYWYEVHNPTPLSSACPHDPQCQHPLGKVCRRKVFLLNLSPEESRKLERIRQANRKPKKPAPVVRRACQRCGDPIQTFSSANRKYCSACRRALKTEKDRRRVARRKQRKTHTGFVCKHCHKEFALWRLDKRHTNEYCSRACRFAAFHDRSVARLERLEREKKRRKMVECHQCSHMFYRPAGKQVACPTCRPGWKAVQREMYHHGIRLRTCKLCGEEWYSRGKRGKGKYCLDCRQITDRIEKFGSAYEAVSRKAVFARDHWTCQHCGADLTRGIPVLDHILPLACGGAHSYANTQCLCFDCNTKKGDKVELEPKLRCVTDLTPYKLASKKLAPLDDSGKPLPRPCACGCGEMYTPFSRGRDTGNAEYKSGHQNRTPEARARARVLFHENPELLEACREAGRRGGLMNRGRNAAQATSHAPETVVDIAKGVGVSRL